MRIAVLKAKARGKVAAKWLKTHKLTIVTQPDFDKLMKQTNAKTIKELVK